jgi:hypothetical protein
MANRVYPMMDAVQRTAPSPRLHRIVTQTDRAQLRGRDNTVLAFRYLCQREVAMGAFPDHLTDKSSSS